MNGRVENLIAKYGAAGTLRLLLRAVKCELLSRFGPGTHPGERRLAELSDRIFAPGRGPVILFRGSGGYDVALFQRPQQLARALAAKGCIVLYEASPRIDAVRGARMVIPGLWLVNLRSASVRRMLFRRAESGEDRPFLHISSPERNLAPRTVERMQRRGWRAVYDYIDAISPEISASRRVPGRTLALCSRAMEDGETLVVCSSRALLRDAQGKHKGKTALIENGVDCAHFFRPGPCPDDAEFAAILRRGRPRLCFYGALGSWLDYGALRALAEDGRFDIVLIGMRYDGSYDASLAGTKNVFFLGPRPYGLIKDYAARCDVMLVPFRRGAVGDAASPIKLFEYMALGKPIVAGRTEECARYKSAITALTPEEYVDAALRALELRGDKGYLAAERAEALAADWSVRAEGLLRALRDEGERS